MFLTKFFKICPQLSARGFWGGKNSGSDGGTTISEKFQRSQAKFDTKGQNPF